ncbi:Acetyltransferase (GNAT) domain-containing protein [Asanoa hainanensis]|uniref:Acetyltransferase (GNAT) domain-containing protein n=1 Tax=Asanoa hainanensis TaxID=560556 RepID=A0A239IC69_9ACTN|nr:GNAT family N-acetyltransferase [Asanoa hainanensis]SNS90868.1 Acetyltransferase (GNAT) domain-containing protein [Asanoa hainanensis]
MIRERRAVDLPGCVAALRAVHEADAYPLNWPADPVRWLDPPGLVAAWVAESPDGTITGHVAIQAGELSRLFVTPAARRQSVGTALVDHATAWAVERGIELTLEVTGRADAVAFYAATGWQHTHTTRANWTDPAGGPVHLRHYTR